MPGNSVGLWHGSSILPDPLDILGSAADGHKSGRILQVRIPGLRGGNTGLPAVPHHLQCGGGCGGASLG